MSKLVSWMVGTALVITAASQAAAQPITILPSSLVRVRADNHFGVTKDIIVNPPVFSPTPFASTITDTEIGTAASATNSATYEVSLTGSTAVFDIQTTQSHTAGSTGNLTEGFIQFTLSEALVYELSGNYSGTSADAGDAYQQRTFLRQFQSPFTTIYLEDETRIATVAALYVNQGNDTGGTAGSTFNQSGATRGVLAPGTYEFNYELESSDRDGDQAVGATATGRVRLVLRKPLPPTNVQAVTTGQTVALSWTASPDAGTYILQAGSAPGASNIFAAPIGTGTGLQAAAPTGTYFVRLHTGNQAALGPPSEEVTFTLGAPACTSPPPAPIGHAVATGGVTAALRWGSSPGATSYMLEAGTASGAFNLANFNVGGQTTLTADVPAGTYFTRLRAVNACGTSGPSNEASFTTCVAPPAPVLTFTRPAGAVRLAWTTSLGTTAYVLQVGTTAGASNIFVGSFGTSSSLTFPNTILPAGIYYMRIVAAGPCGSSAPSADVAVTLP